MATAYHRLQRWLIAPPAAYTARHEQYIRELPKISRRRRRIELAITRFGTKCNDQNDASNELPHAGINRYISSDASCNSYGKGSNCMLQKTCNCSKGGNSALRDLNADSYLGMRLRNLPISTIVF
jgi:hypothetical protein